MKNFSSLLFVLLLFSGSILSRGQRITGQVKDDKAQPVPFATVVETNNIKNGVTAGANGNFVITITRKQLTISAAGFQTVERGYNVGGTAQEHYNKAVTASILECDGTAAEAAAYLTQPTVNYTIAPGTWRQKIGIQKWIALYNRGWDAWIEWRRLDYPKLNPAHDAQSVIPLRNPYLVNEQNVNRVNYEEASAAIGGDVVETRLWWDV